jgi:Uma2 family endonuclease
MPELFADRPITVVPDWICEILSPSTRPLDQRIKRPFYARIGVSYLWFVDFEARTLTVSKLVDGHWVELAVHGEDDVVRAEPFAAVELALGEWWQTGRVP